VLDEKCFFFLEVKEAKVACRNLSCLTLLLRTFKAVSCHGKSPSKGRYKFKTFSDTFGYSQSVIFDVRETKEEEKKCDGFDGNVILLPRMDQEKFLANRDG